MVNEQEIKTLNDREKARTKLPIFFGSFDNYLHSFLEIVGNSRDEIINNFEKGTIKICLFDDNKTISVFDNGRGIPIKGETNGVKNYILLFETLFAGGNYENIEKGKYSVGVNGVGVCVTNYTSDNFTAISYKDYIGYKVKYNNGGRFIEYTKEKSEIEHGTYIEWKLDETIYTNTIYDIEVIKEIVSKIASTSSNIKYIVEYKEETFIYEYQNQTEFIENNSQSILSEIIDFPFQEWEEKINKENKELIEKDNMKLALSLSTEPFINTFLNGCYLKENGTILDGVVQGLRKSFQKELKKTKLTDNDILMSFNIHCIFNSTNPVYQSQTKFSASNLTYKRLASQYTFDNIEIVKIEKPKVYKSMLEHLEQVNKLNTKNTNKIKDLKKILNEKQTLTNKIENLIECKSKNKEDRVLLICEGKSALSSLLDGRTEEQAIFPIRGKILNCLKATDEQIFKSNIVVNLIRALGCGVELKSKYTKDMETFDISNLRYDKIYIVTDADVDGMGSILPLLLTVFYTLTPELIKQNKIYLCETPKYEIEIDNKYYYSKNDEELNIFLEKNKGQKYKINYVKGLAELTSDAMQKCLANSLDNIKKIEYNNNVEMLELFMGNDDNSIKRKEYILSNFDKYINKIN